MTTTLRVAGSASTRAARSTARERRELLQELGQIREALRREVQERVELARTTYAQAREEGADRVRAGLTALRAVAQRHGIGEGQAHGPDENDARQRPHERETDSIKDRLARIIDRRTELDGPEVLREHGPGHGREDVRERLGRILGRETIGHAHAEPGAGDPLTPSIRDAPARGAGAGQACGARGT